jgi:hypothetical protein
MAVVGLSNLCTPAYIYLVISIIFIIVALVQNYGNVNVYCLGSYSCEVPNTFIIFVIKFLYVLFWTWILNLMCHTGSTGIAWFLLLLPILIIFILLAMLMVK